MAPSSPNAAATFTAVVVLPAPPFWLTTAMVRMSTVPDYPAMLVLPVMPASLALRVSPVLLGIQRWWWIPAHYRLGNSEARAVVTSGTLPRSARH